MKIVIAGAGDVGFHLAKLLSDEDQDIILIDENKEILDYAQSHLDVMTLVGDSTSIKTLRDAGVKDADLLVAATHSEQTNIISAVLGKKMGAKKTIARISKDEYLLESVANDFKQVGIDALVSPKRLASKEIIRLIKGAAFTDLFEFEKGKINLIGITIESESSMLYHSTKTLCNKYNAKDQFKIIAIQRGVETIIPSEAFEFQLNDHIYFLATKKGIKTIIDISGKKHIKLKNIMILGGSSIGVMTAKMMEKNYHVKLIERDKAKCFELAEELSNTLIINADGNNVEVLEEEGLGETDAFIALTGNSETNIISSLVAKNHNVQKTIALVENIDYIHLSQDIGVDTLINRKLIAANNVFRHIRKGRIKAITSINGVEAEVIEFEVNPGSNISKSAISELNFPKNSVIGAVIRDDETYLPDGNFRILPGDKVIILTTPEDIHKVEDFLN